LPASDPNQSNNQLGEQRRGSALVSMAEIYDTDDIGSFIDPNYCDQNAITKATVISQVGISQSDKSEKKSSIMSLFIKREST
jgi:hypothetical protein